MVEVEIGFMLILSSPVRPACSAVAGHDSFLVRRKRVWRSMGHLLVSANSSCEIETVWKLMVNCQGHELSMVGILPRFVRAPKDELEMTSCKWVLIDGSVNTCMW